MPREGAGVGAEEARRDERPLTGPVSGRLPAEHSLTDRKVRGAWRRLPGARDGAGTGGRGARPQQEALRTPQSLSFFFKGSPLRPMWTISRVLSEFLTVLLLSYMFHFCPRGLWDLSSPTGAGTRAPCDGRRSPNHWETGKAQRLDWFRKLY